METFPSFSFQVIYLELLNKSWTPDSFVHFPKKTSAVRVVFQFSISEDLARMVFSCMKAFHARLFRLRLRQVQHCDESRQGCVAIMRVYMLLCVFTLRLNPNSHRYAADCKWHVYIKSCRFIRQLAGAASKFGVFALFSCHLDTLVIVGVPKMFPCCWCQVFLCCLVSLFCVCLAASDKHGISKCCTAGITLFSSVHLPAQFPFLKVTTDPWCNGVFKVT